MYIRGSNSVALLWLVKEEAVLVFTATEAWRNRLGKVVKLYSYVRLS